jgi:hypothetical protein
MGELLSLAAVVIAIISLVWTIHASRVQQLREARLANLTLLTGLVSQVRDCPTALRFHNITPEELVTAGVTPGEFAYLLGIYETGLLLHEARDKDATMPFPKGGKRYKMCATKDFQKAWQVVRKYVDESAFAQRVEATIRLIAGSQAEV